MWKWYLETLKRSWRLAEDIAISMGVSDNTSVQVIFNKICPTMAMFINNYQLRKEMQRMFDKLELLNNKQQEVEI